jgi:hypothetical protein
VADADRQTIAACDEIIARLGAAADATAREEAARAMRTKARALARLGRAEEALAAYDRHVAAFGAPDDEVRAAVLRALLDHADAVWGDGRDPRVLHVYDDVLALARPAPPRPLRGAVFAGLLSYGTALSHLGFGERANALPAVVAELFGGAPDEDEEREPPAADEPPDEEVAALLARAYRSDAWRWFAAPDRDRPTADLGARAVALYERTGPVIDGLAGDRDLDAPATAAALLVRTIANGCAILARSGSVAPGTRALVPVRARTEAAVRMLALDRWAADHGHPLALAPAGEDDLDLEVPSPGELPGGVEGFPAAFAAAARSADIVAAARRSPAAPELLDGPGLRDRAAGGVARAVNWAAWLEERAPEAAAAGVAMMLLSQGVFCAVWSPAPAAAWSPGRDLVRRAVEAAGVAEWFEEAGVVLPEWLREP